jgi:hypothetical protein
MANLFAILVVRVAAQSKDEIPQILGNLVVEIGAVSEVVIDVSKEAVEIIPVVVGMILKTIITQIFVVEVEVVVVVVNDIIIHTLMMVYILRKTL